MTKTATLIAIMSVLMIFLIGVLFYFTQIIKTKNLEASTLLVQVDSKSQVESALKSLKAIQEFAQGDLQKIESYALKEETLVKLIENIQQTGRSLGLTTRIQSVTPSLEVDGEYKVKITVDTQGGWKESVTFFRALENIPQKIMFEQETLTKEESVWRGTATFSFFVFK